MPAWFRQWLDRPRIIQIGGRPFVSEGLTQRVWDDIYHFALTIRWPTFFGLAATIFVIVNGLFAVLYQLGDHAIANQFPANFAGAFFFSVETLATVGYGDMHPQTVYGHVVATAEIFMGMLSIALVTGLVFARFSRPRAKIMFANHPVIRFVHGKRTLMIRVANARQNAIVEASAKLHLLVRETSPEGFRLRRIHDVSLLRDRHPVFMLSWSLMHVIDENSPLYGMGEEALETLEATLMLSIEGIDETTSQSMLARHQWSWRDWRWNHRYIDLVSDDEQGVSHIDYGVFHRVLPIEEGEDSDRL
ncbi:inward rectifier potassium channel [Dyella jiangningensis]|uniref:ion channel n=1 Tax=Dyella sp. AtDHG13 TaxID=1938897 RepID=UPI0008919959|nr:ion channel [Dyella sp. AtDHG13]PXV57353.1 inward rectifier potassium channel [Dyella sp. AtDHG13]SDK41284.1 inward rectifier potassium channel [Dyella jiangningensis]